MIMPSCKATSKNVERMIIFAVKPNVLAQRYNFYVSDSTHQEEPDIVPHVPLSDRRRVDLELCSYLISHTCFNRPGLVLDHEERKRQFRR
jgi:hypothetical protein